MHDNQSSLVVIFYVDFLISRNSVSYAIIARFYVLLPRVAFALLLKKLYVCFNVRIKKIKKKILTVGLTSDNKVAGPRRYHV